MGVVDSSLYHKISDTESSLVVGVMLHGIEILPPATPVNVPMISVGTRKRTNVKIIE